MRFLLCFILLVHSRFLVAGEPFLKPNDVVAIVGGEDMVVVSELGFLEGHVQAMLPDYKLKFRSLAWEGDTVFEQRRDLNYPTLEAQLEKLGATVVIAQFGQMESLGGTEKLADFVAAYEKLIARLRGTQNRRLVLVPPSEWRASNYGIDLRSRAAALAAYRDSILELGKKMPAQTTLVLAEAQIILFGNSGARDGAHMDENAHGMFAGHVAEKLTGAPESLVQPIRAEALGAIVAKNRLWHHYARPQNWAFLAGDRTNQPSSRDHKDLSKRWFPDELQQFVPLIEAKEMEVWKISAKNDR